MGHGCHHLCCYCALPLRCCAPALVHPRDTSCVQRTHDRSEAVEASLSRVVWVQNGMGASTGSAWRLAASYDNTASTRNTQRWIPDHTYVTNSRLSPCWHVQADVLREPRTSNACSMSWMSPTTDLLFTTTERRMLHNGSLRQHAQAKMMLSDVNRSARTRSHVLFGGRSCQVQLCTRAAQLCTGDCVCRCPQPHNRIAATSLLVSMQRATDDVDLCRPVQPPQRKVIDFAARCSSRLSIAEPRPDSASQLFIRILRARCRSVA